MKRITIVGIGALGSHVALFLRNEKPMIRVIDMDRVEQKNVHSQFHGRTTVGRTKVLALAQMIGLLFGRAFETRPFELRELNVRELLADSTIVIDCLDNARSRRLVQNFCTVEKIPCVHGALSADGQFGRVVWNDRFVIDAEAIEGTPTCEGGEHLPFIGIVAAFLSRSVQRFLVDGRTEGYEISPGGVLRT